MNEQFYKTGCAVATASPKPAYTYLVTIIHVRRNVTPDLPPGFKNSFQTLLIMQMPNYSMRTSPALLPERKVSQNWSSDDVHWTWMACSRITCDSVPCYLFSFLFLLYWGDLCIFERIANGITKKSSYCRCYECPSAVPSVMMQKHWVHYANVLFRITHWFTVSKPSWAVPQDVSCTPFLTSKKVNKSVNMTI